MSELLKPANEPSVQSDQTATRLEATSYPASSAKPNPFRRRPLRQPWPLNLPADVAAMPIDESRRLDPSAPNLLAIWSSLDIADLYETMVAWSQRVGGPKQKVYPKEEGLCILLSKVNSPGDYEYAKLAMELFKGRPTDLKAASVNLFLAAALKVGGSAHECVESVSCAPR